MTIDQYLSECEIRCGDRWEECKANYAFSEAAGDGLTPEEAVRDCLEWLDGSDSDAED
jgi:hypothetical protein